MLNVLGVLSDGQWFFEHIVYVVKELVVCQTHWVCCHMGGGVSNMLVCYQRVVGVLSESCWLLNIIK